MHKTLTYLHVLSIQEKKSLSCQDFPPLLDYNQQVHYPNFCRFKEPGTQIFQKRNNYMKEECGISSDRVLTKRIIGGNQAKFGEFPWQAYLKISGYQCGGVLGKSA